jgi:prepilin peptidase CpaA
MNTELLISTILVTCGMVIASIADLKTRRIPNLLTFPMMLVGFAYHGVTSGLSGLGFSTAGLGIGISVFLIPYLMGGMGAGDAKLMGAAGAILGPKGVLIAAAMSILIGLVYAIVLLFLHMDYARSFLRRVWMTLKTFFVTRQFISIPPGIDEKQPVLSYGVPIALGTMCYSFLKISGSDFIQRLLGVQFSL